MARDEDAREKAFWFPAKRYGWGWGFPITWQGWLAFGLWLAAFTSGLYFIRPGTHPPLLFVAYVAGMTAVLLALCAWKGEKPRWRWGKEE